MRQRGFTLVGALFLLVVLSALGAYMASIAGVQHTTVALAALGARAEFAARGGLEWALWQIVANGAAGLDCAPGAVSFPLSGGAADGYQVTVTCTATPVTEGAASYTLYDLGATATRGSAGAADFVSRRLVATVAF